LARISLGGTIKIHFLEATWGYYQVEGLEDKEFWGGIKIGGVFGKLSF
jgi:hypothetical protein